MIEASDVPIFHGNQHHIDVAGVNDQHGEQQDQHEEKHYNYYAPLQDDNQDDPDENDDNHVENGK